MDNSQQPSREEKDEPLPVSSPEVVPYPPKFEKPATSASAIWMRSLVSLALYLIIGYYIFPSYKIMLLITAIVMIHELGHFLAMKIFRYKDLGIFFIPLLGAYVSGSKREVSQRESAIILLAGPLPGIMIGIACYLYWLSNPYEGFAGISFNAIAQLFVVLNLFNLLPVYPLDGGQLLNRVFLDEDNWVSKLFIFLSIAALCWFAWKLRFPVLFIFPALMIFRLFGENKLHAIEKRIETEGIDTDLEYDDLRDEDYWKIRNILIEMHPSFKDVPPSPPYEYDEKEEKIMTMIQSLLHRHLVQDVSVVGKIFIFLLWVAAAASPWLLDMDMTFFRRLGL